MPKPTIATASAVTRPSMAAIWARISKIPMAPRSTSTGMAAAMVDRTILPNGSYICDQIMQCSLSWQLCQRGAMRRDRAAALAVQMKHCERDAGEPRAAGLHVFPPSLLSGWFLLARGRRFRARLLPMHAFRGLADAGVHAVCGVELPIKARELRLGVIEMTDIVFGRVFGTALVKQAPHLMFDSDAVVAL